MLQDTDAPLVFVTDDDLAALAPGTMVIDVSCDEGMGFSWARPTTFADPTFTVGHNVLYYAVDHSPSYLWGSATWEISEALLPFLRTVMDRPGRLGPGRPSAGRSRSARASSRTRRSCRSRVGHPRTRTSSSTADTRTSPRRECGCGCPGDHFRTRGEESRVINLTIDQWFD